MIREIFKSKIFVLGFSLLLIGLLSLFMRSVRIGSSRPVQSSMKRATVLESRRAEYIKVEPRISNERTQMSELERKIDGKIDRILSLIDELVE